MRIFSFFTPEGVNPSSYQDIVLDRLSVISDIAQHYDAIQLCHENETGTFGDNLERLRTIYERFPGMGAVFDPANFTRSGCDPLECMVGLKDRVRYVHIKDMDKETGRYVMVGKGDARIKEVLEEIKKGDSKGYMLSLEPSLGEYTHGVRALTGPATFTEYANTLKQILREI